jgi:hypothetical protein
MSFASSYQNKNNTTGGKSLKCGKTPSSQISLAKSVPPDSDIHLQQMIGSQAAASWLAGSNMGFDFADVSVQPKLKVSQPGDAYEQEADRVAERVTTMMMIPPHSDSAASLVAEREGEVYNECSFCKMERVEKDRQDTIERSRKPSLMPNLKVKGEVTNTKIASVGSSGGSPLDAYTREYMESRFGYDFSKVKIHTGEIASRSSNALNALAYTVGNDIVFGEGQYKPNTLEGKRLLAHELAHTIQQRSGLEVQRQVYGPPQASGSGYDFDMFLLQFSALEQSAISDGYSLNQRITAFRKIFYDSSSSARTYAGAVVGGGVWNILIPGAAGTALPPSWTSDAMLQGAVQYLHDHQDLEINHTIVDVGHLFAGLDAGQHPTSVSLAGGAINLRSNKEASTFIGDLGTVAAEYIHNSPASFYDTARTRSRLLESYYDGAQGQASAPDMRGNADAYSMAIDSSKTLTENLRDYYAAPHASSQRRFSRFATSIGLGSLSGGRFSGDTPSLRTSLQEQVFNGALAYAAGKGWRSDIVNVFNDPGPGIISPTFWEMYWNVSGWVVDIFISRVSAEASRE